MTINWTKARECSGGDCPEAARTPGGVALRDSKDPNGPRLHFARDEFAAFLNGVKAGEFDHLVVDA